MANFAAVHQLGETLVALLRARRDLLAAAGQLGPLPAAFEIAHLSAAKLGSGPPTAGLSITCYHIGQSEHHSQHAPARNTPQAANISIELRYLLAVWSSATPDEQAMVAWAMLELARHPILDRSVLLGTDVWEREEIVQILPESLPPEAVFRVWDCFQQKYRLSFTFVARVLRISFGTADQWPPVVATRFGFADVDPFAREPA